MNAVEKTSLVLVLGIVTGVISAQAATMIVCDVPLSVECSISDSRGIERVVVRLDTAQGVVNAVDETFDCPSQVSVSWDPIVPNSDILVTPCNNDLTLPDLRLGALQEAVIYSLKKTGAVERRDNKRMYKHGLPARNGLRFVVSESLRIVEPSGRYSKRRILHTRPDILALPGGSDATADATFCCNEGTLNGCFAVNLLAQCGTGLDFVSCVEDEESQQSTCTSFPN